MLYFKSIPARVLKRKDAYEIMEVLSRQYIDRNNTFSRIPYSLLRTGASLHEFFTLENKCSLICQVPITMNLYFSKLVS